MGRAGARPFPVPHCPPPAPSQRRELPQQGGEHGLGGSCLGHSQARAQCRGLPQVDGPHTTEPQQALAPQPRPRPRPLPETPPIFIAPPIPGPAYLRLAPPIPPRHPFHSPGPTRFPLRPPIPYPHLFSKKITPPRPFLWPRPFLGRARFSLVPPIPLDTPPVLLARPVSFSPAHSSETSPVPLAPPTFL